MKKSIFFMFLVISSLPLLAQEFLADKLREQWEYPGAQIMETEHFIGFLDSLFFTYYVPKKEINPFAEKQGGIEPQVGDSIHNIWERSVNGYIQELIDSNLLSKQHLKRLEGRLHKDDRQGSIYISIYIDDTGTIGSVHFTLTKYKGFFLADEEMLQICNKLRGKKLNFFSVENPVEIYYEDPDSIAKYSKLYPDEFWVFPRTKKQKYHKYWFEKHYVFPSKKHLKY